MPPKPSCQELKQEYSQLEVLKEKFLLAFKKAKKSGDPEEAKRLKKELEEKITALREKLFVSIERAKEILGKDVLGPDEAAKLLNTTAPELFKGKIPPIPFKTKDIEKAKERGEMLVLRVKEDSEGNPLTMSRIEEMLQARFTKEGKGKILFDTNWYKNEDFFIKDTPNLEWKLVSKDILPGSTNKNYIEQTKLLREHLKSINALTPEEEEECTDAKLQILWDELGFNKKGDIADQSKYDANWKRIAQILVNLKINQNHRRKAIESLYDTLLYFSANNERLLSSSYESTRTISSGGYLVHFGHFDSLGVSVTRWTPDHRFGFLGVSSSR